MANRIMSLGRSVSGAGRALRLTAHHVGWLAAAAVTLGAMVVGLAGVSEDVIRHNGLASTDPSRLQAIIDHRSGTLDRAAELLSLLGSAPILVVMSLALGYVLWRRGERFVVAAAPALALFCAAAGAEVLKLAVGRERPAVALRLVTESAPSFPSIHATDAAAFYLASALIVAAFVARRVWVRVGLVAGAATGAAAIGASRLVLGVHWPSDVIAGLLLGVTIAVVTVVAAFILDRVPATSPASSIQHGVAFLQARRRSTTRAWPLAATG